MTNHDDAGQPTTDDELAEVVRLDATRTVDHGKLGTEAFERLQRLGLTLLPRLAREEMARRSEQVVARDDETQAALTTARAAIDSLVTWLRAGGYIPTDESDPIYVHVRDVRHALGGPPLTELEARAWTVQNGWTDPDGRHAPIVNALLLSNRGAIPVEVRDPRAEKP